MYHSKINTCRHCKAVNVHFSFQCPTQRKPIAKAKEPIKKVSDKRAKELRIYEKEKAAYFKANPVCQYPGCTSTKVTLHHQCGRIGTMLIDPSNFRSLCLEHHNEVELNPALAKELGLSKSRLAKEFN